MPTIEWSNGQHDKAPTWQELLDGLRKRQWGVMPEDEFREVLCKRAYRWSHTRIERDLPPVQFFAALERASLIEIIDRHTTDDSEEQ